MGYSMVCHKKPEGQEFEDLGLITTHNARISPVRIYVDKQTGDIMIRYSGSYSRFGSDKCAIAGQYGLDRTPGELYPLTREDWDIIRGDAAMKNDALVIQAAQVTESTFKEYFAPTWPLEIEQFWGNGTLHYGKWFGWYGEDAVTLKDENGELIYTNDLQLLRAIPNWDNIWTIPVPSFQDPPASGQRYWKDWIYTSDKSYASKAVVYSISPFNRELYVVFREPEGKVDLKGAKIRSAWWVDDCFLRTEESAMDLLKVEEGHLVLTPGKEREALMKGVRIDLK